MYKQTAKAYLQQNNSTELKRLQEEGKEAEFLRTLERNYQEQEDLIVRQMTENLPDDPIERAKELNMAQMTAREVSMNDMGEFLSNL